MKPSINCTNSAIINVHGDNFIEKKLARANIARIGFYISFL